MEEFKIKEFETKKELGDLYLVRILITTRNSDIYIKFEREGDLNHFADPARWTEIQKEDTQLRVLRNIMYMWIYKTDKGWELSYEQKSILSEAIRTFQLKDWDLIRGNQ